MFPSKRKGRKKKKKQISDHYNQGIKSSFSFCTILSPGAQLFKSEAFFP
jgi:hypothetical protein